LTGGTAGRPLWTANCISGGTGGTAAGIYLSSSNPCTITSNSIFNLTGGTGEAGTSHSTGGAGGTATGIYFSSSNPCNLTSNTIFNLTGGTGGRAGAYRMGGTGGTATGVYFSSSNPCNLTSNTIFNLTGGTGGISVDQPGATGGTAAGIYLSSSNSSNLVTNTIFNLTGGTGGKSAYNWYRGGIGGTAAGIYFSSSNSNNLTSNTISNLTGGTGGDSPNYPGGSGGTATGIYLSSSNSNSLTTNTIFGTIGGKPGYRAYWTSRNGTGCGVYLDSAANNVIYNNVFNSPDSYYFAGTIYPNCWNTTYHSETNVIGNPYIGGNYWGKPDGTGYSDTCWDKTGDYICEEPYALAANNTDYLPLTYNSFLPVWQHDVIMPWDVERLSDGNTLITEYGNNTVIEVTFAGEIVWQYGNGTAGSGENQLDHPIDAERLSDGNTIITDRDNNRVIEVNNTGTIVWEMNATDGLSYPWDAERLFDGNTLITDKHNNRVIEVDKNKAIVWEMTGLNHPEDAERLSNKNTLIADYRNHRVIEVNSIGDIVWQYGTTGIPGSGLNELNNPTDAERLPDGNTVIADHSNHRIIEVTPANKIIGQYGTSEVAGSGENELNHPADAERLSTGSTLIADTDNNRVIEVIALLPPPPIIVSFTPSSPVYNPVGVERTFSITIDQTVDVEWLLDGILVKSDTGVTESNYTNTSAKEGTWTVSAIASNIDGTDMQQWDWTSAQGPELIVSRIDAYHNKTLYPKERYPPYFNLSNEIDVTVTNIGTEPVGGSNVNLSVGDEFIGKLPVPGLDAGANATVQFKWTPLGYDCEDGGTPVTYTLKAIADCDNDVNESVETNNELTADETAYWAGYSADEELVEASHGTIRGGLLYTTGDGSYATLYSHGDFKDTHYNIELPSGAAVKHARLNVYYTWSKLPSPVAGYPVMEVSITTATGTYTVPLAASYNDRPCDTPAICFEYPWGNYVYDLTPYIQGSGSYTVRVTNSGTSENPSNFCPAAPGLVIVYEDSSMPDYEYWILEGADVVEGGRRGGAGYLSLEECTNDAVFRRSIDISNVSSATLGMVSVWGGAAWGEHTSYYWFNDNYLGEGGNTLFGYNTLYDKTVDGMSMYVGASGDAQVGANVSDVTDYIVSNDNIVTFGDDGDSMMPSNAFLLVEYDETCRGEKPEPAVLVPSMISGSVTNHIDGTPINNPDVAIENMNTGEPLPDVETHDNFSYYQVLTSLANVSCGDVLQFTCDGTTLTHTVRQREMDVGGFVLDIAVEMMPEPDLTVTEKNETLLEDGNFSVTYTVANIGDGNSGASNTTIYIDGVSKKEDSVPALAAGASYTNTVGPFECPCGQTLNVTVCADNNDVVNESDEGNNCLTNEFACPPCPEPDLTVTEKNETLLEDGTFTVNYTVKNIGGGDAGASNTTIYVDGVPKKEDSVPALAAGVSYTNTVGLFDCPCNQTLNITVCADNNDVVDESDEGNNCLMNEFACPPCLEPDLNITDKFETLLPGGTFTVNYTVKNIGGGDAGASNTTIYIDGVNVLEDTVPALAAGASYTNTVGSFDCPCGQTLNVTVCADSDEVVDESDEGNNCLTNELVCPVCTEFIEAGVTFDLKRLDLNSSGILKAFITLPEGCNVTDINVSTVTCENASAFGDGSVIPGKNALEVKFKIPDLEDVPTGDAVPLTVGGELFNGTRFEGSNTLKVV
jgi:subtilase family serine protease